MQSLILAGGAGTRLKGVVDDLPKPMALVAGRPFLDYLVQMLFQKGVRDIIISTGHLDHIIRDHFSSGHRFGADVRFSHETQPLGTAGAVRMASRLISEDPFLLLNGDSFHNFDLGSLLHTYHQTGAIGVLSLVRQSDTSRFGRVETDSTGRITAFLEKRLSGRGIINGGVYLFSKRVLSFIPEGKSSLENDILPLLLKEGLYGLVTEDYFVDIGTPETYRELCSNPAHLLAAVGIEPLS